MSDYKKPGGPADCFPEPMVVFVPDRPKKSTVKLFIRSKGSFWNEEAEFDRLEGKFWPDYLKQRN